MRRRTRKTKINTKLMMDVAGASLIVKYVPVLLDMFTPLDPMIKKAAAVGVGFASGSFLKRPDLSNSAIAMGIVDMVDPFIEGLLSGVKPLVPEQHGMMLPPGANIEPNAILSVEDYMSLNDYIAAPGRDMSINVYRDSY